MIALVGFLVILVAFFVSLYMRAEARVEKSAAKIRALVLAGDSPCACCVEHKCDCVEAWWAGAAPEGRL